MKNIAILSALLTASCYGAFDVFKFNTTLETAIKAIVTKAVQAISGNQTLHIPLGQKRKSVKLNGCLEKLGSLTRAEH